MTNKKEEWVMLDEKAKAMYVDFARHLIEKGYVDKHSDEQKLAKEIYKARTQNGV